MRSLTGAKGPGLPLVPPFVSRMSKVDLRIVTLAVPPLDLLAPLMQIMQREISVPVHEPLNGTHPNVPSLTR